MHLCFCIYMSNVYLHYIVSVLAIKLHGGLCYFISFNYHTSIDYRLLYSLSQNHLYSLHLPLKGEGKRGWKGVLDAGKDIYFIISSTVSWM